MVALDAGTSSIKAAIAEVFPGEELHILGVLSVPSVGIRKGHIVDIESTSRAMDACLGDMERLAGLQIGSALIGFSSASITTLNNHSAIAVGNPAYEITPEDKNRVLHSARNIVMAPDKSIVQVVERQYIIDGYDGVKDPVGMVGSRLEAEVTLILAATAAIQNLQRCVRRINLIPEQIIYNPVLAAESVLLPAEKEMGVGLIDIGGGTTDISVFEAGGILHSAVLPLGGEYVTRDLAIVLKTSLEEAGSIKEKYGVSRPEEADQQLLLSIRNMQGKENQQVSQAVVAQIISARITEMIEMIYGELRRFGCLERLPGGLVLTGGGAELPGLVSVCEEYLDIPVRLGIPENVRGIPAEYNRPRNAVIMGGLLHAASQIDIKYENKQGLITLFDRMGSWLKEFFR